MDVLDLLDRLVRIDSVNPTLDPRGEGEAEMADVLLQELRDLGLDATTDEALPGRPNVVAVLPGAEGSPRLLLEAHMDTVPQPDEPIKVVAAGDRLTGRGACDTKCSCAAMLSAVARLAREDVPHATVVFAAVVDEESAMAGSRALARRGPAFDFAVIGEPTSLRPIRVHNGVVRFALVTHGEAAHTSTAHLGVNAISATARALTAIERVLLPQLEQRAHPLAGSALLTPAIVQGGTAVNIVPDRCEVRFDRRLAPGESVDAALAEIDLALEPLRAGGDVIVREEPTLVLPAAETAADHPLIRTVERAVGQHLGETVSAEGAPYCTDACVLSGEYGIPFAVLGPGSIEQAHTPDEWVSLHEVRRAVDVYVALARALA
jgi:acetylornithine deacetylase/succinyl-diaminopimelate desuccinylase family protein